MRRMLNTVFPSIRPQTARNLRLLPAILLLSACASVPLPPAGTPPQPYPQQPAQPAEPAPPPVSAAEQNALRQLVMEQDRLYRVAAPLLINNAQLCRNNARNLLGFTAKNKYSYSSEFVNAAQAVLGMDDRLKVMGVLAGSGAARAGLQRGDTLLTIEDKPMPVGPNAERQAATLLAPLVSGRSSVRLTVERNGVPLSLTVPLTNACAFGIELGNSDNINAYGDGYRVLITRGMLNFTRSDDELAYVMAREMAHNALSHASRLKMSATLGGIIDNLVLIHPDMSGMGGMAGLRPMPEDIDTAADRLALYMAARAGYNIDNAAAFWRRLAAEVPASVPNGYTALHPGTVARIATIEKTVRDIKSRKLNRKAVQP